MKNFKLLLSILIIPLFPGMINANEIILLSPDKNLELKVNTENAISFSVVFKNEPLLDNCLVSMNVNDNQTLGNGQKMVNKLVTSFDEEISVDVPTKSSVIRDVCNQLELEFEDNYSIVFRVYDNGVAYRFRTDYKNDLTVNSEEMNISFNGVYTAFFPEEESIMSHFEQSYKKMAITSIRKGHFCSLPVYFKNKNNKSILFTETALTDYPGMFISGTGENRVEAKFPAYVLKAVPDDQRPDRNEIITSEAQYIAKTSGKRSFPWRIFIVADKDIDIVQSSLAYQLAAPSKMKETGWIKPGKVAWDWWNANNIYGVDFESGCNNDTYKYYIDFASEFGLDYIILDEDWSKTSINVTEGNPEINVPELVEYGKKKNVGIILWTLWKPLEKDMENILDTYREWGVKGIKVDFMQRLDQYMVNYYERVAREAAKRNLLVDFHGAFKPAGLQRTYPNVLSFEGVKGLEHNKWSKDITPEHTVTLPYIRMVAGPMDFTPGAMDNAQDNNFFIRFTRPMSQGTRCHQIAMYVVYESPLQMLADNPSAYYKERECAAFISKIPVTWDETKVIDGKIGEYIVIARRKGNNWYIGAMTNWTPRELDIDLSFLSDGKYNIEMMQDGVNAEKTAIDYKRVRQTLDSVNIHIKLAKGGGFAAVISKE